MPTDPDKSDPTTTSESPQYPTLIELFRMPAWQHRAKDLFFRRVPVGAGLLASIVVGYVAPDHATRDFFDIAAALIPVLFIALFPVGVFSARSKPLPSMVYTPEDQQSPETRAVLRLDRRITRWTTALFALYAVGLLVAGELSSVQAVLGTAKSADPRSAASAIAFAFMALAAAAMMSAPRLLDGG